MSQSTSPSPISNDYRHVQSPIVDRRHRAPLPTVDRNRRIYSPTHHHPGISPTVHPNFQDQSSTSHIYSTSSILSPSYTVEKNDFSLSVNMFLNILDRKGQPIFSSTDFFKEVLLYLKKDNADINLCGSSRSQVSSSPDRRIDDRIKKISQTSSYFARRSRRQKNSSSSSEDSFSSCNRTTTHSYCNCRYRSRSRNLLKKSKEQIPSSVQTYAETNRILFAPLVTVPKTCGIIKGIVNPLPSIITTTAVNPLIRTISVSSTEFVTTY